MTDIENEAYRLIARIKYSELFSSLSADVKERIKGWMNKYEEASLIENKK
jgi:hypothetical protein